MSGGRVNVRGRIALALGAIGTMAALALPVGAFGEESNASAGIASSSAKKKPAPSHAKAAKKLAVRVLGANSDRKRTKALKATMKALNLGVTTGTGKTVVPGAQRKPEDPYLYAFELGMLGESLERGQRWSLDDLASEIAGLGLDTESGAPLAGADLRTALRAAAKRALKKKRAARSLGMLIVRELGRRAEPGYDLAKLGETDEPAFDALQRALILADVIRGVEAAAAATRRGTANCFPSTANKRIYRLGAYIVGELPVVSDISKVSIGAIWHAWIVGIGISFRAVGDTVENGHYGPQDHAEGDANSKIAGEELEYTVAVEMLDQPSESQIACGALAGFKLPDKGPVEGIEIDWDGAFDKYEELIKHGTVTRADQQTDGQGQAHFRFRPKDEVFVGVGPVDRATGDIGPEALIMNSLGNSSAVMENVVARGIPLLWSVSFHRQNATVELNSRMVLPPEAYLLSCDGFQSGACSTSGQIAVGVKTVVPVAYDPATERVTGRAPLTLEESTGQVTRTVTQGCQQGSATTSITALGSGSPGEVVVENVTGGRYIAAPKEANVHFTLASSALEDILWAAKDCEGGSIPTIDGLRQQHAQWAIHWRELHGDDEIGQLSWLISGLPYDGSIFSRVYQRTAQATIAYTYPVPETSRLVVTPG